jgi:glycosyltransferase involved in cell wall biosynthesis
MKYNLGKIAVIADQMTAFGGADREMLSVLKLFPDADIYTVLYNPKGYRNVNIKQKIYTSFVQKFPLKYKFSKHLKILNPIAYESFNLDKYDTLISISAGPARGIIPSINQIHIALVMTPSRSLWDHELNVRASIFKGIYSPISKLLNTYLRIWDKTLIPRVDYWIANSKFIAKKIKKRYGVEAEVIYPGISQESFEQFSTEQIEQILKKYDLPKDFMLVVSRLYDYKRIDWAIEACIENDKHLVIVGDGPDKKYLKKLANGSPLVHFLGFLENDREVRMLYRQADALLFCGVEDFGLVPIEAMAQGTPILAYNEGGVTETVSEGTTGEFFKDQKQLSYILNHFNKRMYNPEEIIQRASGYTEKAFLSNLDNYFAQIYESKERET